MTDAPPRIMAECTSYLGMIAAMRARAAELGIAITSDNAADVSGLGADHLSKLFNPERSRKCFGIMSLGAVLGLLGLRIQLVVDDAQTRRVARRIVPRSDAHVRHKSVYFSIPVAKLAEMRKKGGQNSRKGMKKKDATRLARKAILARFPQGQAAKRVESARHAAMMRWSKPYRDALDQNGGEPAESSPLQAKR